MPEDGKNVKPVQPVSMEDTGPTDGTNKPESAPIDTRGLAGRAKSFLGSAANTAGGAVKNGFYAAKNSWFGVRPITVAVSNGVGKAADFMRIPKKAAGIALAVILLGGGGAGTIGLLNYNRQQLIFRQEDYWDPCGDLMTEEEAKHAITTAPGDVDAQRMEVAKLAWALGKKFGMTDEQCAGMLGNMQAESGFDPYSVEAIFDEPFQIGPRKAPLFTGELYNNITQEMEDYTLTLPSKYSFSINLEAYRFSDGRYCAGIGLIGFTGPFAEKLMAVAESEHKEWFDTGVQLAVMVAHVPQAFQSFLDDTANAHSVTGAAASYYGYMERGAGAPVFDSSAETRGRYATEWYARLSPQSSSIEREYGQEADEIFDLIGRLTAADGAITLGRKAADKHAKELSEECGLESNSYDNSTLAAAAVAYAWPNKEDGVCNNGTELYQEVHDAVRNDGDPWYQSCDRGTTTAIMWSGADDNVPRGACQNCIDHFDQHPELWERLGTAGEVGMDGLEPGDIVVGPSHIYMYVGIDIIREKYPDAPENYNTVSASIGDQQQNGGPGTGTTSRSPGCGQGIGDGFVENMGDGLTGTFIYRYIGDYTGTLKDCYTGNASGTS